MFNFTVCVFGYKPVLHLFTWDNRYSLVIVGADPDTYFRQFLPFTFLNHHRFTIFVFLSSVRRDESHSSHYEEVYRLKGHMWSFGHRLSLRQDHAVVRGLLSEGRKIPALWEAVNGAPGYYVGISEQPTDRENRIGLGMYYPDFMPMNRVYGIEVVIFAVVAPVELKVGVIVLSISVLVIMVAWLDKNGAHLRKFRSWMICLHLSQQNRRDE